MNRYDLSFALSRLRYLTDPSRLRHADEAESDRKEALEIARSLGHEWPEDAIEELRKKLYR